jgi:hypothetical protein
VGNVDKPRKYGFVFQKQVFPGFFWPARKSKVDHIKPGKDTSYQKAKEIGPDTRWRSNELEFAMPAS